MEEKTLKILAIETDNGYYIVQSGQEYATNSYDSGSVFLYLYDGKPVEHTFNKFWGRVESKPEKITKVVHQPNINERYELIDKKLHNKNIPLELNRDDITEVIDGDYVWVDKYKHLRSLYILQSDKQPDIQQEIPFELKIILKVDNIKEYAGLSFDVEKLASERLSYNDKQIINITEKNISHQHLDTIVFPSLLLPSCPCKLSSEHSYRIVREYVKQNINPKVAQITSDYDFCFTVKKKVLLSEPIFSKREILNQKGKSYKIPKYKEIKREERLIEIFEMTYSPKCYQGYTVFPGFVGKDQEDLINNIEKYLKKLINKINEPFIDCPHCKGIGVVPPE
jgi:hypothetical protein